MTTNKYALTHSERGWLLHSVAYMISSIIYGLITLRFLVGIADAEIAYAVLVAPIIFLLSLCLGFASCTAGHYTVRISRGVPYKEDTWSVY